MYKTKKRYKHFSMRRSGFLFLLSLLTFCKLHAQLLPPNQPEQDACNALQLCGNAFTTPFSYQGNGQVGDLGQTPCGGPGNPCGEDHVVWIKLVVNTPGTIVFTITPIDIQDDYDFAIVDATGISCSNLSQANVIRCNFNNNQPVSNNGIIGLNTTSTLTSVAGGTTGSPYLQQITAAAGNVYLIMINNFGTGGGPSSGFTINFAGSTATFVDNTPPHLASLSSSSTCNYKNSVTVHLNTPIACNSITASGSDFQLTPSGTIASASGVNCSGQNGYTQDIILNFNPPLAPNNYTLRAHVGTDNNTLLNLCGNAVPTTDSLTFSVNASAAYATASLNCTTLTVTTNVPVLCSSVAANASDFNVTGPGAINITGAAPVNCNANGYSNTIALTLSAPLTTSGTYTITSQNGTDGNTLLDDCGTNLPVGNTVTFSAVAKPVLTLPANLTTCINTGVQLPLVITNPNPGTTYTYQWTPAAGLNNATIAQPLANPTGDVTYTVVVGSTSTNMCTSQASVQVHSLQGFDITNNDTAICEGNSVQINATGSDEYTYTWTPAAGVSNPNIKNPVITPTTLGMTTYSLTAKHTGCNDSTQLITIDVQPNPEGLQLSADRQEVCQYDTVVLHAEANPVGFNFNYTWTPAADMVYTNNANNLYIGNASTYVSVTASTPIGCSASDSVYIKVNPGNFLIMNTNDTGYCVSGEIPLLASNAISYNWTPPAGLSATDIPDPIASPSVTTTYYVVGTDAHGCKDTQSVVVGVYQAGNINMPDSVSLYHGEVYHLQPETNCTSFSWFPPAGISDLYVGDPYFNPTVRTRYFVKAYTGAGCFILDSIDILVRETVIDMPNAFAPGTGGPNGVFKPAKRGIANLKSFNIYNRWGQKVFETRNIEEGWDGTFNNKPQAAGVYVYTIEYITDSGSDLRKQGNVTLVR